MSNMNISVFTTVRVTRHIIVVLLRGGRSSSLFNKNDGKIVKNVFVFISLTDNSSMTFRFYFCSF